MSKSTEGKKLVPRLRFPEFRDAGEWVSYKLKQMESNGWIKLGRGQVISAKDIENTPGPYPIYSSSVNNDGLFGTYGKYMFDEELISWSIDGGGHFFYRKRHKFSLTNVSGYIRVLSKDINTCFLAYQLKIKHSKQVFDYLVKAHPNVIRDIYFLELPYIKEQQKIADFLSSIDELIEHEANKLEALKKHKKGLMQQLFPREGERVPRLRFPEFRDAGEWEERRLGELIALEYGAALPNSARRSGKIPVVGSNGVVGYHNEALVSGPAIVVGRKGSAGEVIWVKEDCYPIDTTFYVKRKNKKVIKKYIYYTLTNVNLPSLADYGAVPGLNRNEVYAIKIAIPSTPEQQKIANFLSTIDELIEHQTNKLEALKKHKKGLMQRLFPQEEV